MSPLVKTVALVVLAGAAGSMIAAAAGPLVIEGTDKDGKKVGFIDAKHAGAVNTGLTAGGAALVYVLLSSAI